MYRNTFLLLLTCGLSTLAAELPKAETLLDAYVEATGGRAAYAAIKTQRVTATVEFVGQGVKGQSLILSAAGGRSHNILDLPGIGKIFSGVKDGVSWESSAMQGSRLREGEERTQNLRLSELGAIAKWRDYTEAAEVVGEEEVEGKACWKLKSRTKGVSGEDYSWIEKASGLMLKSASKIKSQMGEVPMESYIRAYRREGQLLVPVLVEQKVGPMLLRTSIDKVENNIELPESAFDWPAEISALLAKKK